MIQLSPTDLWAVNIGFKKRPYKVEYNIPTNVQGFNGTCIQLQELVQNARGNNQWVSIVTLPKGDWEILGICTKDDVMFDASPYVEQEDGLYIDYILFRGHLQNYCETAEESLRSLLAANGVAWANPLGSEPVFKYSDYEFGNEGLTESMQVSIEDDFQQTHNDWKAAENKVVKGNLLIIKKIK